MKKTEMLLLKPALTNLLSSEFTARLRQEGYFVDDLLMEIEEKAAVAEFGLYPDKETKNGRTVHRQVTAKVVRQWTGFSNGEIKACLYNPEKEEQMPLIRQAIASLSLAWLEKDLMPPDLTVKQVSRRTGLAPERIIKLVDTFQPKIENGSGNYALNIADSETLKSVIKSGYSPTLSDIRGFGLSPKRILKDARYQSRPPGGGPIQRTRLQDRKVPDVIRRMAAENARVSFQPFPKIDADRMFNLRKSIEPVVDPDIAEVIKYFKEKGGKKWLRGTDEAEFARVLRELAGGRKTDVLIWNCFDFDWEQKKPGKYPACIINDGVDTSILDFHIDRVRESVEYLSLLGPVSPIALIPSNEANAPVWKYVQSPAERETVVDSVVNKLTQKINITGGVQIEVMRWDEYLASRGINKSPAEYSLMGTDLIYNQVSKNRKEAMIRDDQAYFEQFGLTVSRRESEKRVFYYYGVYAGEGMAMSEVVKLGRNLILLDIEEFRVGEMTALGSRGTFPIVSPVSTEEKQTFYRSRKEVIQNRESKI